MLPCRRLDRRREPVPQHPRHRRVMRRAGGDRPALQHHPRRRQGPIRAAAEAGMRLRQLGQGRRRQPRRRTAGPGHRLPFRRQRGGIPRHRRAEPQPGPDLRPGDPVHRQAAAALQGFHRLRRAGAEQPIGRAHHRGHRPRPAACLQPRLQPQHILPPQHRPGQPEGAGHFHRVAHGQPWLRFCAARAVASRRDCASRPGMAAAARQAAGTAARLSQRPAPGGRSSAAASCAEPAR